MDTSYLKVGFCLFCLIIIVRVCVDNSSSSKCDIVVVKPKHKYQYIGVEPYKEFIIEASKKYSVEKELIEAVIIRESAGNPRAHSHAGAKGLMQLIDGTAKDMGVRDVWDPKQNIMGGTKYLSIQLRKYGSVPLALAAYNAGPGAVYKYNGIPPYKETQDYVKNVMAKYRQLKNSN